MNTNIEMTPEVPDTVFGGWADPIGHGGNCMGAHVYEDTGTTHPLDGKKYMKEQICRRCFHMRWIICVE